MYQNDRPTLEEIIVHFPEHTVSGNGYKIKCPSATHSGDGDGIACYIGPGDGDDGGVSLHCHSGQCDWKDIMDGIETKMGLINRTWRTPRDYLEERAEKAKKNKKKKDKKSNPVTIKEKNLIATYQHPDGNPRPTYRTDHDGACHRDKCKKDYPHKHIWGPNSPEGCYLLAWGDDSERDSKGRRKILIIVEGEKAAQALLDKKIGNITPVTYRGGAGMASEANYEMCANRRVMVWPDNDTEGHTNARESVDAAIMAGAAKVGYMQVEHLGHKFDAYDVDKNTTLTLLKNAEQYEIERDANNQPVKWGGVREGPGSKPLTKPEKGVANQRTQTRTKMINWSMERDLPYHLRFDEGVGHHVDRMLRYFPDSFLLVVSDTTSVIYVPTGPVWSQLRITNPKCKAAIKRLMSAAALRATLELPPDAPAEYAQYLNPDRHNGKSVYETIMTLEAYSDEMNVVDSLDFNDRNSHPILPFTSGRSLDFTTGELIEADEAVKLRMMDVGWTIPETDQNQKMTPPVLKYTDKDGNEVAKTLTDILADQYGTEAMMRIAAYLLGTSKRNDVLRMPSDAGKTTLYDMLKRAFPGMFARFNATSELRNVTDSFPEVPVKQVTTVCIFFDEATHDTAQFTPSFINDLDAEERFVNRKFEQRVEMKRIANTMIMGAEEWPHIQADAQGFGARFKWANDRVERADTMSFKERNFLLSKPCTDYVRHLLLKAACNLWKTYGQATNVFESQEIHQDRKRDLASFMGERTNDVIQVLRNTYRYDKDAGPISLDSIIKTLKSCDCLDEDDIPNKRNLTKLMQTAMKRPNLKATEVRNKETNKKEGVYKNIIGISDL